MSESATRKSRVVTPTSLWPMVIVLLLAAVFRFGWLDQAPPGWRDDELIEFDMDRRIVAGWRPLFITEAEGHEPVYHYLHAVTIAAFGENVIGYKWLPFAFGGLIVALTYALARRMFDRRVAWLAAGLLAVSFWPTLYARLGLRHVGILPPMLGMFLALYPKLPPPRNRTNVGDQFAGTVLPGPAPTGDESPVSTIAPAEAGFSHITAGSTGRLARFIGRSAVARRFIFGDSGFKFAPIVAGVLLAAALMTYFAGRALPLIWIGFLVYLLIFNRALLRRTWFGVLGALVVGGLLAAPMFVEIARTPGAEKRTEVVGGPLIAATRGDLRPAIETTLGTLGMFTFAGDPESLYNLPGRPVFDGLTGLAFYLGVLLCLVRLKRPGSGFALVWLVVGIAPAFVSLPAASFSHTLAAMPVVYVIAAYGAIEVAGWLAQRYTGKQVIGKLVAGVPLYLLLLYLFTLSFNAFLTLRDYFGAWANDPFVRFQYHAPTRDLARWLDRNPDSTDVAVGTHPNELALDPLALQLDLRREDVRARWFNPETALVLPVVQGYVVFSLMQPPTPEIESLRRGLWPEPAQESPNNTKNLSIYRTTLLGERIRLRANFEGVGMIYWLPDLRATSPGAQVVQQTNWQIVGPIGASRLKMFIHVLDRANGVIAGDDREDVDVSTLLPGDIFFQVSKFMLPADMAPGQYQVEVGWYHPDTGERLRLPDGSDRLLLDPLEVVAP